MDISQLGQVEDARDLLSLPLSPLFTASEQTPWSPVLKPLALAHPGLSEPLKSDRTSSRSFQSAVAQSRLEPRLGFLETIPLQQTSTSDF